MIGIYKITSPNNKIYIGQSYDINRRINKEYSYLKCKKQRKLYNSLKKYGFNSHKFEIVEELLEGINQEELDSYEIYHWQYYKDLGFEMLNLKEPGKGGKHCEKTKSRISNANRGRRRTEEQKKNISEKLRGRKMTTEHIDKIRVHLIGRPCSQETKNKMRISQLGTKHPNRKKKDENIYNFINLKLNLEETCTINELSKKYEIYVSDVYSIVKNPTFIRKGWKYRISGNIFYPKNISQYDLHNNFIRDWNSAKDATIETGISNIYHCLRGRNKTAGGYIWKRKNNT